MKKWWLTLSLAMAAALPFSASMPASAAIENHESQVVPLAKAHAHNDYEHTRPLYDALDHGFTSVEADVWLKDGDLQVAHNETDVSPERTLKTLYLDPLKKKVKQNNGSVYKGGKDFLLWIDVKSEGKTTYKEIDKQLAEYKDMLTKFTNKKVKQGAITVIISGNRDREGMQNQTIRYAGYDGRMSDLGSNTPNSFIPVISDNWTNHFTWQGVGEMPKAEHEKLVNIVKIAHTNGQMVRFWATPDMPLPNREAVWKELLNAGVDLLNTDDLPGLQEYLLKNDPHPTKKHIKW
ncbi:phosphatidylinositol-specific phospholipase C/glycerophosphodiester phosphodiesterase family protein [Peribacillus kribbensis]|uniref:phosphatidylinositol-specific phospholipase C/glycerophosphodiester phosphodiesterase family protein n=1 Tax=Peribacillus kribbensis TaxID=356658 RepID=UPI0004154FCB|nr:phosphatidylinositol-specific phospholipase C/glycerophosphodiester phosphodiesterase family protein [Peribacillus kribbensis]